MNAGSPPWFTMTAVGPLIGTVRSAVVPVGTLRTICAGAVNVISPTAAKAKTPRQISAVIILFILPFSVKQLTDPRLTLRISNKRTRSKVRVPTNFDTTGLNN